MTTHPEQSANEIYVGNVQAEQWPNPKLASLATARLGDVAYGVDGDKLPVNFGCRPLFVGRSEADAYDSIMMADLRKIRRGMGCS